MGHYSQRVPGFHAFIFKHNHLPINKKYPHPCIFTTVGFRKWNVSGLMEISRFISAVSMLQQMMTPSRKFFQKINLTAGSLFIPEY